jgi:drug/metabolite transporter (DMT)-like permease
MEQGRESQVACVLTGSAGFGSTPVLVRLLYRDGAGVGTALTMRYSAAALVSSLALVVLRRSLPPRQRLRGWALVALVNGFAALAFWSAVEFGNVAQVTPVVYLYLALVVAGMALAMHEVETSGSFPAGSSGVDRLQVTHVSQVRRA